jgi:hypothetical protein
MKHETTAEAVGRADKKLRQAAFFLGHLHEVSRRPGQRSVETIEFFLSACLTAAQSAFYVLRDHTGDSFNREHRRWRMSRSQDDRAFLNRMISLRDDDVHSGVVDATSYHSYIDAETVPGVQVFGPGVVELENPDGTRVRGRVLMGVELLYIEHAGQRIEAGRACQQFIALLGHLVDHFRQLGQE